MKKAVIYILCLLCVVLPVTEAAAEGKDTDIPAELVGIWEGEGKPQKGGTIIHLTVRIEPDGTGEYSFDQGSYHESFPFMLSREDNHFSVDIPATSYLGKVEGTWKLEKDVLLLDITSTFTSGGSYSYLAECRKTKLTETGCIGIISAMENEVRLLLSEADIDHVDIVGGVEYHVGTLCGQDVVIAQAGIGKVLSAAGASVMLSRYSVSCLIFTGIAGGVGDETKVLDMVIATELVQHDYGTMSQDGFVWAPPFSGGTGYYACDAALVQAAYDAAVAVVGEGHVFRGRISSGDQFIASEAYVKILQEQFGAIACEMEGASVAAVAERYGVPFVVIRSMSDKADGAAHDTIDSFGDAAADNSGRIVMKLLESMGR